MNIALRALIVAAALSGATTAYADNGNGAVEIARHDYAAAERMIVRERRTFPADADLMLNLAVVYAHTGRASEARALYLKVLAHPDEAMDLPGGGARSSHAVAKASIDRLDGAQLSAR